MKKTKYNNLIYGRHPVLERLSSGEIFDKIFLQKGLRGSFVNKLHSFATQYHIPIQLVPTEKLNRLTHNQNHQGVAGFASLVTYYDLEDVLSQAYASETPPLLLLCDGITDVRNFGAIVRTAACTGVHGVVIPYKGMANINADAIKSSAGTLHKVPICKVRFLDQSIQYLQNNGVQVVASSLQTKQFLHQIDLSIPTAILIGAEGKGVSPKFLKQADQVIKIPMVGNFDSFNVSVATGMLLYESVRQRF